MLTIKQLMSEIDCSKCNAICCKKGPVCNGVEKRFIAFEDEEVKKIIKNSNIKNIKEFKELTGAKHRTKHTNDSVQSFWKVFYPCYFLKENKCSIYEYRPLNCMVFPFEDYFYNGVLVDDDFCPEYTKLMEKYFSKQLKKHREK